MIWQDVEPGFVIEDEHDTLWLVTHIGVRMDDSAHPFMMVRIHCLSDDRGGTTVFTQESRALEAGFWKVMWRPE